MRSSDWSSYVCSSDLNREPEPDVARQYRHRRHHAPRGRAVHPCGLLQRGEAGDRTGPRRVRDRDRKGVVEGKSEAVRVDRGGWRIHKKKGKEEINLDTIQTNKKGSYSIY